MDSTFAFASAVVVVAAAAAGAHVRCQYLAFESHCCRLQPALYLVAVVNNPKSRIVVVAMAMIIMPSGMHCWPQKRWG